MISNGECLLLAAVCGHSRILRFFEEKIAAELLQQMLVRRNYLSRALRIVLKCGHLEVLEWIARKIPAEIFQKMITRALPFVFINNELPTLDFLLKKNRTLIGNLEDKGLLMDLNARRFVSAMNHHYFLIQLPKELTDVILRLAELHPFFIPVALICSPKEQSYNPFPLIQYYLREEAEYIQGMGSRVEQGEIRLAELSFFSKQLVLVADEKENTWLQRRDRDVETFFCRYANRVGDEFMGRAFLTKIKRLIEMNAPAGYSPNTLS